MTTWICYVLFSITAVEACSTERQYVENLADAALTGSSHYSSYTSYPRSRLNTVLDGEYKGAWSAGSSTIGQFIQADLGTMQRLVRIATQGRQDYDQWVTAFKVAYSLTGSYYDYITTDEGSDIVFTGNSDRNTIVENIFDSTVVARYIRVYPQTWYHYISLRWEVSGCSLSFPACQNWELFAFGLDADPSPGWEGYLKQQGGVVYDTSRPNVYPARGMNVISISKGKTECKVEHIAHFDTHTSADASSNLATWMTSVSIGDVIIGVTSDEASRNIDTAVPAFESYNLDLSNLAYRYALAFAAVRTSPEMRYSDTEYEISPTRQALNFTIKMERFEALYVDLIPAEATAEESIVSTFLQCSIRCAASSVCYSFALTPVTPQWNCLLYDASDVHESFVESPGSFYVISMLNVVVTGSAVFP